MKLAKYLEKHRITQAAFGKKMYPEVTQGAVWQWMNGGKISPEYALQVEAVTDRAVTRYELRPDIYPRDSAA